MLCPFCGQENTSEVSICQACRRDIVAPLSLLTEHRELLLKREQLRDELTRARAKLGVGHRWFGVW
jgi:hypothetical protein